MTARPTARSVTVLALGVSAATPAAAQVDLARTRPPASSQAGFALDTPGIGEPGVAQLGLQLETAGLTLVLRDPATGAPVMDGRVLERRHLTHLAGAVALTSRLEVGLAWAAALQRGQGGLGRPAVEGVALADLEFRVKYGGWRARGVTLALLARTTAPTGDVDAYLSGGGASAGLSVLTARQVGPLAWTANVGFRSRPRQRAFDLVVDDEVEVGLGARLPRGRWWLGAEALGAIGVAGRGAAAERPMSALGGGGVTLGGWTMQLAVGAGLTRGYGAPTWQAMASVRRGGPAATSAAPPPRVAWEPPDDEPAPVRRPPPPPPAAPALVFVDDRLTLSEQVLFATGADRLRPEAIAVLAQVIAQWRGEPTWRRLRVEGHADQRGAPADNLILSQRRADAVRAALIDAGGDPALIEAVGFGETRPVADGVNPESHARNRRVELVVERSTPESP